MKHILKMTLLASMITVSLSAVTKVVKYKIKSGETLYTIAHKHKTTIKEVRKMNGLKQGDILKVGKTLKVPTNTYKAPTQQKKRITKKRTKNRSLKSALSTHAQPFYRKRKRRTKTVDNMIFRSPGFNFGFSNKK
ncbi:MAG: LysM peptidoglycan-binding domain-containing protein, partial [Sulfurovum sp.]|nr:LysM peptidoglycan-binding domain-containing protein [Sulfurovum sp.]